MKKKISFISPCYNESENIEELISQVTNLWVMLDQYDFEFVIIDNASTDNTREILIEAARKDSRIKLIFNTRNFGHIRSPYWGLLQTTGDASIYLASDLQDPPDKALEFIKIWEQGYKVVLGTKPVSKTSPVMHGFRKLYYHVLDSISNVPITRDSTGFGLYDKVVIDELRRINDPYPFLRGLISEIGYQVVEVPFEQPRRMRGVSKNNIYTLYDIAILGLVSHSLVPIRLATFFGFIVGGMSILAAIGALAIKLLYWNTLPIGVAPIIIVMFFMFGIILLFIGILGEYIGSIHSYVQGRPIVVEEQRINF